MFLPSKHLLSAFYKTLPSKNPSKNLVFTENRLQAPSKNPSKKHLLLENLLRTLLKSVLLYDPLGVHPIFQKRSGDANPQYFSKNTAVQMGGVLQYKREAYCSTNGTAGFPFL